MVKNLLTPFSFEEIHADMLDDIGPNGGGISARFADIGSGTGRPAAALADER